MRRIRSSIGIVSYVSRSTEAVTSEAKSTQCSIPTNITFYPVFKLGIVCMTLYNIE